MDMEFWDYTPDERREWRSLDLTAAFMNELRKQHRIAANGCVSSARSGAAAAAAHAAGLADGIEVAASLMEGDK